MVNRVLLDQNGLKISQPGSDVLAATPGQLWFASERQSLQEYANGVVSITSSDWNFDFNDGTYDHFDVFKLISHPKTYPSIPMMAFTIDNYWGQSFQRGHYLPGFIGPPVLFLGVQSDQFIDIFVTVNQNDWRIIGSCTAQKPTLHFYYRYLEYTI